MKTTAQGMPAKEQPQVPHESARLHVSGKAHFVNDLHRPDALTGYIVTSEVASGRIRRIDTTEARKMPGVHAVLTSEDIPGVNNMGAVADDEPCLASGVVQFVGQAVALVAADTPEQAEAAARKVMVSIEPLPAFTTLKEAMQDGELLAPPRVIHSGDVEKALSEAPHVIEGTLVTGAQEHWYLETQSTLCIPAESHFHLISSTQHPSETQALVAGVLGLARNRVQVEAPRLGGAFGGKETQASHVACWASLLAHTTGRPVRIHLGRQQDMSITGKRHRFLSEYRAGYDSEGRLLAVDIGLHADGGAALDLSVAIMDRAMFHVDNAYFIPNLRVTGRIWKTNLPPNTAFRGFGAPQGMAVIETIVDRIARACRLDAAEVRKRNFYETEDRNVTHYGERVERNLLQRIFAELTATSSYRERREAVDQFNRDHPHKRRGLALTPVKFGISFTTSFLNQAAALVNVYQDGSVVVNHGGVEMGQGLHTKIMAIAAAELGIGIDKIRVTPTDTQVTPNTSATAASSGTDLNGMAVRIACDKIRERLEAVARDAFNQSGGDVQDAVIRFEDNMVFPEGREAMALSFEKLCSMAYRQQVSLSATGFYRTPDIHFDKEAGRGRPFNYYAFGMAVSEVEVDLFTGMHRLLRTDILHDAGESVNEAIDLGQVYGGFIQGLGWVTTEAVLWDDAGRLLTDSPDTYKIPTFGDIPEDFRVALLRNAPNPVAIRQSKAVGEPPFMLALSVWLAIKDAVGEALDDGVEPPFELPATYEVILRALQGS